MKADSSNFVVHVFSMFCSHIFLLIMQAVTEELNTQRNLNKQQQVTIDDLMRTNKRIQPQIPTNVAGCQSFDFQVNS